jgi:RNA polymerase sigma-70 factor, ECF subfamily
MDSQTGSGSSLALEPEDDFSPAPLSAEQVYHAYAPRVYHVARRMLHSDLDAEDVTQDVLLKVVRKLPTFRGASAFPTWLHRITVNTALSHRRKTVREEGRFCKLDIVQEGPLGSHVGRFWAPEPQTRLLLQETQHLIAQAVERLPEMYRTVFVLSDIEEMPNADIAEMLGLSLPAIKSRLHRARQLLRQALAPHFDLG